MRIHHALKALLLITTAVLLPACKSINPRQLASLTPKEKQEYIETLEDWSFTGKIAIIPLDNTAGKKQSATIHWQQNKTAFDVDINTFLGINILNLEQIDNHATLSFDGNTYKGTSAEALINTHARLSLPLTYLPTWLKGIARNTPFIQLEKNTTGRVQSLTFYDHFNQPWQLAITQYAVTQGLLMPRKFIIQNNRFKIRLIITQWQFANE